MSKTRAVIIGAGITGALTAVELSLAGFDVTVLEGAHIGNGSSSRSAAGIRQQFSTAATVQSMRHAVRWYQDFPARAGTDRVAIRQVGYLFLHDHQADWAEVEARVRHQQAWGLTEVELLAGDDLRERFPWAHGEALRGGTFCPTDGFLHPDVIYADGLAWAERLGTRVVQKARVTGCETANGRIRAVHTPKGAFEADLFIDATNAWSRRTARVLGAEELPVDPLKRYLWFLARGQALSAEALSTMPLTIAPGGAYCRPEHGDSLLFGKKHDTRAQVDFDDADQDEIEAGFHHKSGVDAAPFEVWSELAEAIPPIGEMDGLTATTCGYYATTPDHNPFFGFDRWRPNLLRLVGFSGHGAMMGPFTALVARALCEAGHDLDAVRLDDGTDVPLDLFRIGRGFTHAEAMVI